MSERRPVMERLVSKATGQFRKPSQVTVHATLCICQLLWAGMHIVVNGPLDHLEPFCFAMTRIGLALPFLAVFAWHERPSLPSRKELAWAAFFGCTGIGGSQSLILLGNKLAGASVVVAMQPSIPVYVALLSWAMGAERITPLKALGIASAVAGALVLLHVEALDISDDMTAGVLVLMAQCMFFSIYLIAIPHVLNNVCPRPVPYTMFFWGSFFAAAFISIPASFCLPGVDWAALPGAVWVGVFYTGFISSTLAQSTYMWITRHSGGLLPAVYGCIQPVFGLLMAWLLLGENVGARELISCALVILGLAAVTYSRRILTPDPPGGAGPGGVEAEAEAEAEKDVELEARHKGEGIEVGAGGEAAGENEALLSAAGGNTFAP